MGTNYNTWIASLSSATLAGTETVVLVQSSTTKKATIDAISAYAITTLASGAVVNPALTADEVVLLRSNVQKTCDIDVFCTYVGGRLYDAASEADPVVSGDMLLAERSNVIYRIDVDTLTTFILNAGSAATIVTPAVSGDMLTLFRSGVRKTIDVDTVTTYVLAAAFATGVLAAGQAGDEVFMGRSGTPGTLTIDLLASYVQTAIQTNVRNISALDAATLGATDQFLVVQTTTPKKTTLAALETKLWTDFGTYVAALSDAATVVDSDKFYLLNGSTPKYCTATELETYCNSEAWDVAAAAGGVAGDTLLINRSGTGIRTLTIDLLTTYALTGAQATILDISGLNEATLTTADLLLICQSGTARQSSLEDVAEFANDALAAHTAALTQIPSLSDTDVFYIVQGSTQYKVPLSAVVEYVQDASTDLLWALVDASKYTTTPASTSTLTMSDTSDMAVGLPLKYVYNSITYYGIVTAVSANTSITIAGAPFNVGYPLTSLKVGQPEQVTQLDFCITSVWDDAVQDLLAEVEERYYKWQKSAAYLVAFSGTQHWADSGASQGKINVKVGGSLVSTEDSNKGITPSATPGTWVNSSAVAISTANYSVDRNDAIDIRCTEQGTTGDAECVTISMIFVSE